jgi:hypothetical protein
MEQASDMTRPQKTLGLLLLAACGLCLQSQRALAADQVPVSTHKTLNPLSGLDPSSFKSFVEKPLFSPTRSAPNDPVSTDDTVASTTSATLNIRLLGVIATPEGSVARVIDLDDNSSHALRQGETYNEWTVTSIAQDGIDVEKDGERASFSIFAKTKASMLSNTAADRERGKAGSDGTLPNASAKPRVVRIIVPTALAEH